MKQNKLLKGLVVFFVITGALASLGLKFWADGERLTIEGPSFLRVTPTDELGILLKHKLVISNSFGKTTRLIDFEALGIHNQGDFDFFSNGDLLVYHREYKPGFLQNIARFLRMKELSAAKPIGDDGLYRCDVYSWECRRFAESLPAFKSAFRLFIDRQSDEVYIADTPRFEIYKMNSKGDVLAKHKKGYKFPNQILLQDARLYIANTNFHEVRVVDPATERFGKKIESHTTRINQQHRWPSQLAFTGDRWWVVIMDNGMKDGLLRVYDTNWNEIARPALDAGADPVGMTYFREKIHIADWTRFKIYRFNYDGSRLDDFINPDLQSISTAMLKQQATYRQLGFIGLAGFIVVLVGGVFAAFILEKQQTLDALSGKNQMPVFEKPLEELQSPPGQDVYWIQTRYAKRGKVLGLLMWLLVSGFAMSYVALLIEGKNLPWSFHSIMVLMIVMCVYVFQQFKRMMQTRIGVQGETLFIDDGQGDVASGKAEEVAYNAAAFMVGGKVAMIGAPHQRLFPKEELDRWVIPRFERGRQLGQWELQKILWKQKHPAMNIILFVIGMMLLMLLITNIAG